MPEIPYGDWLTAVLTILYLQLLTWRKWYGWPLGMATQGVWIYLTLSKQLYGLTALSVIMAAQFAYGWWYWRQRPAEPHHTDGKENGKEAHPEEDVIGVHNGRRLRTDGPEAERR